MKSSSTFTALALCLMAGTALANSPDSMFKIVPRPPGASVVGLTATYGRLGLLYSADGGETFGQMCKAFAAMPSTGSNGRPTTLTPYFNNTIITHDGRFIVGDLTGLWVDDGHGCNWRILSALRGSFVSELRFDPRDAKVIYGATITYMADNGLFRIDEDLQVERIGVQGSALPFSGVRIAPLPGGGLRFYAFGAIEHRLALRDEDGGVTVLEPDAGIPVDDAGFPLPNLHSLPHYSLHHSDDFGETWTSHELEGAISFSANLEGVDPKNPDRVVISRRHDNDNRGAPAILDQLLVSEDRGQTFRTWLEVASISGVSFAQDGTVFVADRGEGMLGDPRGLWRAERLGAEPELIADYEAWCVEAREDRLEVCQRFEWGIADPKSGAFTKLTSMRELAAFHSCDGHDSAAVCREELCASHCLHWAAAPLCAEHYPKCAMENMSPPASSGAPDASPPSDAGSPASAKESDGCSCSAIGRRNERARPAYVLSAAFAALLRIRRRRSLPERSA